MWDGGCACAYPPYKPNVDLIPCRVGKRSAPTVPAEEAFRPPSAIPASAPGFSARRVVACVKGDYVSVVNGSVRQGAR